MEYHTKVYKDKVIRLLQTLLFLEDGVSESDIMVNYNLGPYLNKAKKLQRYLKNELYREK